MNQPNRKQKSIFVIIIGFVLLTTVIITISSAFLFHVIEHKRFDRLLEKEVNSFYNNAMLAIKDDVWALNDKKTDLFLSQHSYSPHILSVKIINEYNDTLSFQQVRADSHSKKVSRPIHYNNELIGSMEITLSTAHIYQKAKFLFFFTIGVTIFSTLILSGAIWLILKAMIFGHLTQTAHVINDIADGHYDQTLPHKYKDFNIINSAVRVLAEQIKFKTDLLNYQIDSHIETSKTLKETQAKLQKRVDKRNLNLAITNDLLQDEINERKKTEIALLKAKEDAENANRSKSNFIANMSHELRTPMNAVIGISKMLRKQSGENLNKKQKEGLKLIHQSGKRLLVLINDILDLSKVEAGKMKVFYEPLSIHDLVESVDGTVGALIKEKDIYLTSNIDKSVPNIIVSDPQKLNQILLNLLGNSIKFTNKGSISLKIFMEKQKLYFEISDTGIGIAEEHLSQIFDKFNQADESITKKYTGTGLGLTLCKEFIELLKGKIEISSEVGKGTTITFNIPIKPLDTKVNTIIANETILNETNKTDKKNKAKILIADDEEIGRYTFGMILATKNYELLFAKDGQEAIEKYKSEKPDLILMDIMMPDINGFEAFNQIRDIDIAHETPIIAVTAQAMLTEKKKIIKHGFDSYISKPIDDDLLHKTISKYLD